MKACFGYVRVSTAKQGEGVSLEAQTEAITAFAERHGLSITRWFEEKETAAKSGRPVFNAMVAELRRGRADGLIIHKIDRSARNFADWAKIGDLADSGIDVHFATESLDFSSRGGRLTADIQAVIAADYIRNLREETIKGITGRLKQGLYPFKAPLGYLDNGGGKPKTLDPVRAPLVRQAFELYASGRRSLRSLVIEMDRRGLRTEKGRAPVRSVIETMLGNPFYCGLIRLKRTGALYKGIHEPLISTTLFEEVQARKSGRTVQKRTRHQFAYRGLFRCQSCHNAMIAERQKGHVYYRCQTKGCPTKTVREEVIETTVWQTLRDTKLSDVDVAYLTEAISDWFASRRDTPRVLTLTNELEALKAKLDRLTDALIDRLIDEETFNDRKARLLMERARFEEQKHEAEKSAPSAERVRQFLELAKNLATTYLMADPVEKREIVEITTSNRFVRGKSVGLEPSNWLRDATALLHGLTGPPERTTDRTNPQLWDDRYDQLNDLISNTEGLATRAQLRSQNDVGWQDHRASRPGRGR